ncbi:hypothetical protein B0O99DRAFT_667150 [Bisporella sp. PMI_857]|nr:hypothetical protein B0O99DRAFT_667150 [Bisporella sp. PMI_857]
MWKRLPSTDALFSMKPPPAIVRKWVRSTPSTRFSGMRLSPTLKKESHDTSSLGNFAFPPPEPISYRIPDTLDTFATYKFRSTCDISSLQLHTAFSPLCHDRRSLLTAMSSGGRIGHDSPYMPRGCDMRWFTSEEACEILGRFDKVVIVGDSMLRHVMGALNILIRKDVGYGAVTDWNFNSNERRHCFCNEQFDVRSCSVQGIYKTMDVETHDPASVSCKNPINVIMEQINKSPVPTDELERLRTSISGYSVRPKVFIFGHGLWSNLNLIDSIHWLDTVMTTITNKVGSGWKGLLVTPSASGRKKPDEFIVTQGNKALMIYEEEMGNEARKRGLEHLGTWNMSIQARTYDGVHLDMRGNMVKAMMILNWLNLAR